MKNAQQVRLVSTLNVSADELARARSRVNQQQWKAAAENLRKTAEEALADATPLPQMDTAWYDAEPGRPFDQTYIPFHYFIDPAAAALNRARTLAWAAMILDDARYLERARQIFLHIVGGIACHVQHHDSGMQYGLLVVPMAELYTCLAGELTDPEHQLSRDKLTQAAEATLFGTQHWLTVLKYMPYSNHLAFQRHGLLSVALVLGRQDWIDEAIDGTRGFGEMLGGATFDDGLCYESSTLYHYATLRGLFNMAQLARQAPAIGRDLYRESFANGRTLKQMIDAPLGMLLPGGELPAAGDCYARRAPLWKSAADVYELAYSVYGDPQYAWIINRSQRDGLGALVYGADSVPAGTPPGGRSRLWIQHGYNLLTSAANPEAYWDDAFAAPVAFVSTDRNGIHHHIDRLGLQMAAAGRVWLEDVESAAVASEGHGFVNPIQVGFNRTTFAHNLVLIDQQNQKTSDEPLRLLDFKDLPDIKTITLADTDDLLYDGVKQMRTIAVTDDYLLDVYQVDCGSTQRVADLLLHPRADGPADIGFAGDGRHQASAADGKLDFAADTSLPDETPYQLLRQIQSADLAGTEARMATAAAAPLTIAWRQGDAVCNAQLSLLEGLPDRLFSADWPRQSDWQTGGRQMLFLRAHGTRMTFVTVYQIHAAVDGAATWRTASAERYFNGQQHEIRIRMSNGKAERWHVI